jgi:hypothetical protein
MNTKKIIVYSLILAGVGAATLATISPAGAYRGDYSQKGPNYTAERHEAMEKAFNSNDYNAWKELMQGRGRASGIINQSNFAKFSQAHKLAEQGKIMEADAIRKELGLRSGDGRGTSYGRGMGMGRGRAMR